jgi:serine/threonine protein kinase
MPASYDDEKMKLNKIMIPIEEIRAIRVLGRGATGTVFMVLREGWDHPFALKVITKAENRSRQDAGFNRRRGIEREREILSSLRHPFLPSLIAQVETEKIVGWVVECCRGGDLHRLRQIQPEKTFSESAIRFYAAEVVLALEHLHGKGIVYRDLKPENILVQSTGHIMLTDFDLSTRLPLPCKQSCASLSEEKGQCNSPRPSRGWLSLSSVLRSKKKPNSSHQRSDEIEDGMSTRSTSSGRSNSFVGTDEYVAPEIVNGSGHEFAVDWWALGIFLYEMLYGKTPFRGADKKETYRRILWMRPQLTGPHSPLHDLILRLLEKDPRKRLGSRNGSSDVKGHVFFTGLHWDSIESLCRPPVVPDIDAVPAWTDTPSLTIDMESFVLASRSAPDREEASSDSQVEGLF